MTENNSQNITPTQDTPQPVSPAAEQTPPPAAAPTPAEALLAAQNEIEAFKAKYMTALADIDNLRKRHAREREEFIKYGLFGIMGQLLPFVDNFELALASAQKLHPEAKAVLDGFGLLIPQLMQILTAQGLTAIKPSEGAVFDPNLHQSVGEAPSPTVPHHAILALQRPGYTLNDRLLRPAMVILSSGPAQ